MHRYKCLYSTVTSVVCYSLDLDYSMIYNTILEVLIGLELERGGGLVWPLYAKEADHHTSQYLKVLRLSIYCVSYLR